MAEMDKKTQRQINLMNPNPSTHCDMGWANSQGCYTKVILRSQQDHIGLN